MRRTLSIAALTAVLLTSACAGERADIADVTPGGTPTSSAAPTPSPIVEAGATVSPGTDAAPSPTTSAADNSAQVCAAAQQISNESAIAFVSELTQSLTAASQGDTAAAEAARGRADAALGRWAIGLRERAAEATDERLRALLTEIAAEVDRMEPSVESVDAVKLDELQQRLERLCTTG
ncbi:MAG TPA: hypothetical protein VF174_01545 [Micromonosporaceae bacterium]